MPTNPDNPGGEDEPNEDDPAVPLNLATLSQIVDELERRWDSCVISMEKDAKDPTKTEIKQIWFGSTSACLGLTHRVLKKIDREMDDDAEEDSYGE